MISAIVFVVLMMLLGGILADLSYPHEQRGLKNWRVWAVIFIAMAIRASATLL